MASAFFGENKSNWTDMSDYVVHFATDYQKKSAYDDMRSRSQSDQYAYKAHDVTAALKQIAKSAIRFGELPHS